MEAHYKILKHKTEGTTGLLIRYNDRIIDIISKRHEVAELLWCDYEMEDLIEERYYTVSKELLQQKLSKYTLENVVINYNIDS